MFKKRLKTILLILVGLFIVYTFYLLWAQSQPKPVSYRLVKPERRTIQCSTIASGTLEARTKVELKPKITGIIEKLYVEPGQMVKSGDIVAHINVIPDMSSLNQAQNAVESARIELAEMQREAQRSQRLFEQGVVSREENEKCQSALETANESYEAALCQVDVITKGYSKRSSAINTTEVRSSMDGIVINVPVKTGSSVSGSSLYSEGTTIATICDMTDVIFKGKIDEVDIAKLYVGMNATMTPGSMPGIQIPATIEFIAPEGMMDNGAKVFEIKAAAHIPEGVTIRSGYSVNTSIILDEVNNAICLDETCVSFEKSGAYVYQLKSDPADTINQVFDKIPVELGLSDGIYVEVKNGIDEDMIIRGLKK